MGKVLQRACFHWLGKSSLGLWNHKLACWSSHIMDNNKLGLLRRGLFQGHIESLWGVNLIVEDVIITHTLCKHRRGHGTYGINVETSSTHRNWDWSPWLQQQGKYKSKDQKWAHCASSRKTQQKIKSAHRHTVKFSPLISSSTFEMLQVSPQSSHRSRSIFPHST